MSFKRKTSKETWNDLVIDPYSQLEAELDAKYLEFIANLLLAENRLDRTNVESPSKHWLTEEAFRVSHILWPGTSRLQQAELLKDWFKKINNKESKDK